MRRLAAIAVASACAAACTAIAGLEPLQFVDAGDASTDTGPGGGDAQGDTEPTDASADRDGDARGPTGCSFVDAEFCDDFDRGEAFSVRWSSMVGPQGPCSMATSSAEALSAPMSLRAESLANAAKVAINVALEKRLPSYQGEYFVGFDVLFKVAPSGGTFLLQTTLTPTYGNNNDAVNPMIAAFSEDGGGVELTAFNLIPFSGTHGISLATIPLNQWVHVEASVRRDVDAAATNVRFRAADQPEVTRQIATEAPSPTPSSLVGISSGGSVVEVFFDNVVMDTR